MRFDGWAVSHLARRKGFTSESLRPLLSMAVDTVLYAQTITSSLHQPAKRCRLVTPQEKKNPPFHGFIVAN